MTQCNLLSQDNGIGKRTLFLAIYVTVLIGIVFSGIFMLSAVFSSPNKPLYSIGTWLSSVPKLNTSATKNSDDLSEQTYVTSIDAHPKESVPVSSPQSESILTKAIWGVPVSSKMPDLAIFQLTKEMVESRAKDNVIIVTFGNFAFMDFILNWVRHLTEMNVFNLLVGAMDTKLLEALYRKGVPVFDMGSNMSTIDAGWGSPSFHKMGREKVFLINAVLHLGYELLMCDTDMVWLKNPLPYMARFPEADILTSSDQVIPTVIDDSLEVWQNVSGALNIGIFHWRPTDEAKKLAKEWKELLLADDKLWDQSVFNKLVYRVFGPSVEGGNRLVYSYDGKLKLGILPANIFCSGHTYFIQAMPEQLRLEPYAVHTTFQYSATGGKHHRLREAMLFYDPPEYYVSPGGFLSFKSNIPKSLLLDGAHTVDSHFSLVNYQLKNIRTALAVASLLNRTLVMPPLWCRLDRLWFRHTGIIKGTMTRQPFLCPMDHVFEINQMLRKLPDDEFGPTIDFREYSFLRNPLLPKEVKMSLLEVQLCNEGDSKCEDDVKATKKGILRIPKHNSQGKILEVFSKFKDIKVLEFSTMEDVFQGFSDKDREAKFRQRVKTYVGVWCCVGFGYRGHIYYDMYWDEKPGWRPQPPKSAEDDHPPW